MKLFSEFSDTDIKKQVTDANAGHKDDYEVNTKFVKGDHWQEGKGWAGALPQDSQDRSKAIKKIKDLFTSQNVIKEVIGRHKSAVISKDPEWDVTIRRGMSEDEAISEKEQKIIDEATAALSSWWKTQDLQGTLGQWLLNLLKGSRSVLRIYIPDGFKEGGSISSGDLTEQIKKIRVEVVEPGKGAVIENKDTAQKAGMISFTNEDDEEVFEISFLDDNQQTILKNVSLDEDIDPLSLGGHLTIYEASQELFITEQIRQQQKMLNKAHTMMNNNLDSGFLERVFLNAEPPGRYETDDDGKEVFVPAPYNVGPGTTNFINAPEVEDQEGNVTSLGNASVTFREPVENSTFVEAKSEAYASILQETHQMHALISGDATASGESRIQALADFIMSAQDTKSTVDAAGRWIIETVMYLAYDLAGTPGISEEYKATFNCRIDPGNIPADLRDKILKQVEDGLLSRETAMAMLGVDDVDAELAKIDSAAEQAIQMLKDLRDADINSKTLNKLLVGVAIKDKQFIVEAMENGDMKDIEAEIEAEMDRRTQESDLTGALIN